MTTATPHPPEEAIRHFYRGMAALEMAESTANYEPAIKEFEQAASLAPNWPDAYYNLAIAQEKAEKHSNAIASLKQYLRLAPDASNSEAARRLMYKLEYQVDQALEVRKVFTMMSSGLYEKHLIGDPKIGGDENVMYGPFLSYNSLNEFRSVAGKMEVRNVAFDYDKKGLYHPELRPPNVEWAPVRIKDDCYEYRYVYWVDVASGHVAEVQNRIEGKVISINPPRVREVIRTVVERGIRIPRDTGQFVGGEGWAECIFEWRLK